jgi:glycosyltransferase involved in cell wall biosynthesis
MAYELAHVAALVEEADGYDVVHNHCGELLMAFSNIIATPMLTTVHGPMDPDTAIVWKRYGGYYNVISKAGRAGFPEPGCLGVVYNGIDVESFPFCTQKDDFLLFLGRVSEEKGTHLAIDVAEAVSQPLIIAGKVDRADVGYFKDKVEPRIDGSRVQYVGEADAGQKRDLFARAKCLLHPVTWQEPFGLVLVEAMACGTPVIGMSLGSIPEVVLDGETGFVVDSVDQMIAALSRLGEIDPRKCRERAANQFSVEQMVDGYERLMTQIVAASAGRTRAIE